MSPATLFPYTVALIGCFRIVLCLFQKWGPEPGPTAAQCFVYIIAVHPMHFCRCQFWLEAGPWEYFLTYKVGSIPLVWGHFILINFCLASYFLFPGPHFSKPNVKMEINWYSLLDSPVRASTAQERDEHKECKWSKWQREHCPKKHSIPFSCQLRI